jgi:hypothetical protein
MHLRVDKRIVYGLSNADATCRLVTRLCAWPVKPVYLVWDEGEGERRVEVRGEEQLIFACRLVSEDRRDDWAADFARREAKAQAHMEAPSSDDEGVTSDQDITQDDWRAMGMRREFY